MEQDTIKTKEQFVEEICQKTIELRGLCEEAMDRYSDIKFELKNVIDTKLAELEFARLCKKHNADPEMILDMMKKGLL